MSPPNRDPCPCHLDSLVSNILGTSLRIISPHHIAGLHRFTPFNRWKTSVSSKDEDKPIRT